MALTVCARAIIYITMAGLLCVHPCVVDSSSDIQTAPHVFREPFKVLTGLKLFVSALAGCMSNSSHTTWSVRCRIRFINRFFWLNAGVSPSLSPWVLAWIYHLSQSVREFCFRWQEATVVASRRNNCEKLVSKLQSKAVKHPVCLLKAHPCALKPSLIP